MYKDLSVLSTLNREKLKLFPLWSGQGYALSALLLKIVLEVLINAAITKEKGIKGIPLRKKEAELCLFIGDVLSYIYVYTLRLP